jgi:hypothetical protein
MVPYGGNDACIVVDKGDPPIPLELPGKVFDVLVGIYYTPDRHLTTGELSARAEAG